jgi:phage terminase Nu1 subunit (DNA packaging protein)
MRLGKRKDVAKLMDVNVRTIDRMRLPRVPIKVKPGQRPIVRFDLDEIEAIIEKQKREGRGLAA